MATEQAGSGGAVTPQKGRGKRQPYPEEGMLVSLSYVFEPIQGGTKK